MIRHRMSDALLAQVADVYIEACDAGENPTGAVKITFKISRPSAGRWVMLARQRGMLAPTTPGKSPPKRSKKLLAVAAALGVDPDALERAVLQHAGGGLRVHSRGADLDGQMHR